MPQRNTRWLPHGRAGLCLGLSHSRDTSVTPRWFPVLNLHTHFLKRKQSCLNQPEAVPRAWLFSVPNAWGEGQHLA